MLFDVKVANRQDIFPDLTGYQALAPPSGDLDQCYLDSMSLPRCRNTSAIVRVQYFYLLLLHGMSLVEVGPHSPWAKLENATITRTDYISLSHGRSSQRFRHWCTTPKHLRRCFETPPHLSNHCLTSGTFELRFEHSRFRSGLRTYRPLFLLTLSALLSSLHSSWTYIPILLSGLWDHRKTSMSSSGLDPTTLICI